MAMSLAADVLMHHLRLVGLKDLRELRDGELAVGDGAVTIKFANTETLIPSGEFEQRRADRTLLAVAGQGLAWGQLRSFHSEKVWLDDGLVPVVVDGEGQAVWAWSPSEQGGSLLIGTDLVADLILIRQGDPLAAANRPTEPLWGIAGERPNYLFEAQLDPGRPFERLADWWLWTLRDALMRHAGVEASPVLPGGAPGVIVITGDDDQAPIEDYRAQRELLGDLPVTYFLHPLCKLDQAGFDEISAGRKIEWELHPDALETPGEYPQRFAEQGAWFEGLIGRKARLVRNHGFLNDGYWGHARPWLAHGIVGSSNIPGVDGRVVNGSLLPARLVLDGKLTSHVSLLTAFGDGAIFVGNWDAATTIEAVLSSGRRIIESGVPGVLVFNLHPANHLRAAPMHQAVQMLAREGFIAMTMGEALYWFDHGEWPIRSDSLTIEPMAAGSQVKMASSFPARAAQHAWTALSMLLGRGGRSQ